MVRARAAHNLSGSESLSPGQQKQEKQVSCAYGMIFQLGHLLPETGQLMKRCEVRTERDPTGREKDFI